MIILIVEDDGPSAQAMREALMFNGHSVLLASTSDEAREVLGAPCAIEVVILDLRLGGDRAEDFVQEMQAESIDLPPVVVISGQTSTDIKIASKTIRPFTVLQKPCSTKELLRAIEHAVV
jgi:DNA-binding NtrC family response regulator